MTVKSMADDEGFDNSYTHVAPLPHLFN